MGCCANDGLLRMCKHQRGKLSSLHSSHKSPGSQIQTHCRPLVEAEGCTDEVLPLLAPNVPHVVWDMNQSYYWDCAILGFGKSFAVFRSGFPCCSHLGEAILDPPRAKSAFVHFVSEEGYFLHGNLRPFPLASVKGKQRTLAKLLWFHWHPAKRLCSGS